MNSAIDSEKIIILDFGSQYTQLIARRIRELGVYSEILSFNTSYKNILKENPKGIIISGGPESVNAKNTLKVDPKILESETTCFRNLLWHATHVKTLSGIGKYFKEKRIWPC